MKCKKLLFVLSLTLLASSCGNKKNPSSNTSGEIESNQISTSEFNSFDQLNEKEKIVYLLNEIASSSSFEATHLNGFKEIKELFTNDYVVHYGEELGYVLLNENVYKFSYEDEKITLLHKEVDGNHESYKDLARFSALSIMKNKTFTSNLIKKDIDGYYIEDVVLLSFLASSLNYGEYDVESNFPCARVSIKDNNLTFTLQTASEDYTGLEDFAKGTITNINLAKDSKLETFVKDYKFEDKITDAYLENVRKSSYALDGIIDLYYGDGELYNTIGKTNISFNETNLKIKIDDYALATTDEHFYTKDSDNKVSRTFLNGLNEIGFIQQDRLWDDIDFPYESFNNDDFYKLNETTYRYFGNDPESLIVNLARVDLLYPINTFDLNIVDNKVDSIHIVTSFFLNEVGLEMYYDMNIKVNENVDLTLPQPLSAIEETPLIEDSFANFKNKNYTLKIYDTKEPNLFTQIKYTDKAILQEVYQPKPGTSDEYLITTSGYAYNKNNEIVSFIKSNDSLISKGIVEANNMFELLNFDLNPTLLRKSATENCYFLRENILDLNDHMFGGKNLSSYKYDTFVMNLDEDNRINNIRYDYAKNNGLVTGTEMIDVFAYDKTTISEDILTACLDLVESTSSETWEALPAVYEVLVEKLGKEVASIIPYLYDETLDSYWNATAAGRRIYIDAYSSPLGFSQDPTNYMERYEELLKSSSLFTPDLDGNGDRIYVYKDILEIKVENSPVQGITITLL